MSIPDGGAEELAWGLLRVPGAWPSKGMWTHVHEYRAILWNGRVFWEVVREVEFRPDGALESRYDGTAPTLEEAAELDAAEQRERAARRAAKREASDS